MRFADSQEASGFIFQQINKIFFSRTNPLAGHQKVFLKNKTFCFSAGFLGILSYLQLSLARGCGSFCYSSVSVVLF